MKKLFILQLDENGRDSFYSEILEFSPFDCETRFTRDRDVAIALAEERGQEIDALIINMGRYKKFLSSDELIDDEHPMVHVHRTLRSLCRSTIPSFLYSIDETVTPDAYDISGDMTNFHFIPALSMNANRFAEMIVKITQDSITQQTAA